MESPSVRPSNHPTIRLLVVTVVIGVDGGVMSVAGDGYAGHRVAADSNGGGVLHHGVRHDGHLHVDGVGAVHLDGHGHLDGLLHVDGVGLGDGHGVGLGHLNGHWAVDGHVDGDLLVTDHFVGLGHWHGHLHVLLDGHGHLADHLVGLGHRNLNFDGHALLMNHRVGAVHMDGHWDSLGDGDGLVDIGLLADHIWGRSVVHSDGRGGVSDSDRGAGVTHGDGGRRRVASQSVSVSGNGSVSQVAHI